MINRVPCDTCGAEILSATAVATGGICMACSRGIRRTPVERAVGTANSAPKETVTVAPNGHIHISGDDGSYTHINVSRIPMSAGDFFLHQLQNMAELRKKVTSLVVTGKAADLEKSDLEPLMRLWIKGVEAEKSGETSTQFFLGPKFADEFKNLSTILTAAGINLNQFSVAAFAPVPTQASRKQNKHLILPLVLVVFLVLPIVLDDLDYSFFVVLRFAVCASYGWWGWKAHEHGQLTWRNIFAITALFYNPFVPLSLEREWWQAVNGLTIALTLFAASKQKTGEQALSNSGKRPV